MTLEERIKSILNESKKSDPTDEEEYEAETAQGTKSKKDKIKVEEESIPGLGADLKGDATYTSGAEKEAKLVAKQKSTQMKSGPAIEKDTEVTSGSKDSKGTEETSKIEAGYKNQAEMGKLKAEAFEALFSGENLSEEFKIKAQAIFEAAVAQVANKVFEEMQEEYLAQLDEAVEEVKGELVEQIDVYLDEIVGEWITDNAVALESGIKVDMANSVMESLKSVLADHQIEVPDAQVSIVAEQTSEIEALTKALQEATAIAEKATAEAQTLKCEAIIATYQEGLTAIESDKLYSLAENVEFDTEEEFEAKVKVLRESYFTKSGTTKITTQETTPVTTMNESYSDVEAVMRVLQQDSLKLIRSSN
jgi:hypothetical protein